MLRLARTVRFSVNSSEEKYAATARNGYAGVPSMRGLGRHYELTVSCVGEADTVTGYYINIKDIDRAARQSAVPLIAQACRFTPDIEPGTLLPAILSALNEALGGQVEAVSWHLSPYYQVAMHSSDTDRVLIRQRFEFAAAHRLHSPSLSDDQNRATFGRCNNPSGHGHNYTIEPAVSVSLSGGSTFTLDDLERVVAESVLQRFDHTHLNIDTSEFAAGSGLNPSVENIAKVCFDLLAPALAKASGNKAELKSMTVWETEKTSCTYPA